MKHVRFYYIRHGRTEFNRDGIIQGGLVDSPLVEESKPQIEATARALMGVDLTRCYSSPLGRAMDTACIVLAGRDVEVRPLDDLREFEFGRIDGLPHKAHKKEFSSCYMRQDFSSVGGERGEQVRERVAQAFQRMYEESEDGQNVLVVAHGSLFRYVFLNYYPGGPLRKAILSRTTRVPNASICVLDAVDGRIDLTHMPRTAEQFLRR